MRAVGERIVLAMPGRFENIDLFQHLGQQTAALCGFDEDVCFWIGLALREAVNNAILHGNREDFTKEVHVAFTITPKEFQISVKDEGPGFSVAAIPDPLNPENLMKTSGRGIFYIRSYMDRIDLSAASRKGGEVRMFKRRPSANAEE